MGSRCHNLPFILVIFFCLSIFYNISINASSDWSRISPSDPNVVRITQFAVTEHNSEQQTYLVYDSVVDGETYLDNGRHYKLGFLAKDAIHGYMVATYAAHVVENPNPVLILFTGPL
ncbi:cysteine proteinase inhibitor 4-like [Bidens hawaiensis]|uniref:cysteine proteinase inhibitor 4-like n=1 Tax=Bidens hawaiensis TaxID=980011 RepID=UPI00404B5191